MSDVLILEDNKFFLELFENKLRKSGYKTVSFEDAYSAMDYMADNQLPKVVVLDILLPAVTGVALINEMKSHADMRDLPIIVCTSIVDRFTASSMKQYGINFLLDKSTMEPNDLVYAVKSIINYE